MGPLPEEGTKTRDDGSAGADGAGRACAPGALGAAAQAGGGVGRRAYRGRERHSRSRGPRARAVGGPLAGSSPEARRKPAERNLNAAAGTDPLYADRKSVRRVFCPLPPAERRLSRPKPVPALGDAEGPERRAEGDGEPRTAEAGRLRPAWASGGGL